MIEQIARTPVTSSIKPPTRRMYGMSPLATPLLMMSALRFGRYSVVIAWTVSKATMRSSAFR